MTDQERELIKEKLKQKSSSTNEIIDQKQKYKIKVQKSKKEWTLKNVLEICACVVVFVIGIGGTHLVIDYMASESLLERESYREFMGDDARNDSTLAKFFRGLTGPDFEKLYDKYCDSLWADVGSDGSYLSIDTNPINYKDYYKEEAFEAIKDVNRDLDLPDSLLESMEKTRALDGEKSETYGKVKVSWIYHPDTGLEVTYSKK